MSQKPENDEEETMEANEEAQARDDAPKNKTGKHLFQKGWRGGPGRPKKIWTAEELMKKQIRSDLKAVARDHTHEAFTYLVSVMRNEGARTKDRMDAANQIINRGWGKPTQQTEYKIDVYDKMSDAELIKLITGKEITQQQLSDMRGEPMLIEHETNDDDE